MRFVRASLCLVVACLMASCTAPSDRSTPRITSASTVVAQPGLEALPHATAEDWVTYGDHVVTVKVVNERRDEMSEVEKERGEGLESRRVTLEIAGDPSWSRVGAQAAPTKLELVNGGWWITTEDDGTQVEREFWIGGQTAAEVGKSYVALLIYSDYYAVVDPAKRTVIPGTGAEWIVLDLVPLVDGAAVKPAGRVETPILTAIAGKQPAEIAALLRSTPPDPHAAKYMDLDPVVRYQYVLDDTVDPEPPAPEEHR